MKHIVLVGGGHTHALVLQRWIAAPPEGAKVTLVSPDPKATYSGMLPGFVAGHYQASDLEIDLEKLCQDAGADFICNAVTGIDVRRDKMTLASGVDLAYDVASLDVGITTQMPYLKGFSAYAAPAKPLDQFADRWSEFLENMPERPVVSVIGGGVAGVELAFSMSYALSQRSHNYQVYIIDRSKILQGLSAKARRFLRGRLDQQKIQVLENRHIEGVDAQGLYLDEKDYMLSHFVVGAAGARPHEWLGQAKLDCHDGFVGVGEALQTSAPNVFAAGDCAHMVHSPRPKAGVYAVRQAPILDHNLKVAIGQSPSVMQAYKPQQDYLKLISLGPKRAMAEKFGFVWSGALMWRLKNRIDRAFMSQF